MKILITGVGGPTPRSFAISLRKYGKYQTAELVGTDSNQLAIGLYQPELFSEAFLVPAATDPEYWIRIEEIVNANAIDAAVVLPEQEVLEWGRRQATGVLPCSALIPDISIAEALVDKARMTQLLSPIGSVPRSVEFNRDLTDLSRVTDQLKFPFWVRSASGTSGLGSLKVEDMAALRNWILINPTIHKFLASEFLEGRNLACKLLYFKGKLMRAASAERVNYIMSKVSPSGITGNTSFGRLLNEPDLVVKAGVAMQRLFESTSSRPHGFFTVDFKENGDGFPLITEINVRHVAFTQCFAAAGANFAEDTISLLTEDPSFEKDYKMYKFQKDLIFLRDVDALPVVMKESQLLSLNPRRKA